MKVHELLARPEAWNKIHLAATKDGEPTWPENAAAVSFCVMGAAIHCYKSYQPVIDKIGLAIMRKKGYKMSISQWNVLAEHSEVLALCKELDI